MWLGRAREKPCLLLQAADPLEGRVRGGLQVPILFNLSEAQRFQLAQRMVQRDVPAGEVVFRQGDQGAGCRPHIRTR